MAPCSSARVKTRFSMAVNLLAKDGKVLDDNMVPNILKFGPVTPNGEYYEITVTTDDRVLTPARLDALQATIDHPEDWSAEEVANAKAQLPGLQAAYDKKQQDKRTIVIRYARTAAGEIIGAVKALDDDTSVYLQASPPWEEPSTYEHDGARSIVGQSKGLRDASKTGHFRLDTTQTPDSTAGWATVKDMLAGMVGKPAATGDGTAAQRFELSKGETVTFRAEVSDRATKADPLSSKEILRTLDRARAKADDNQLHGNGPIGQATTYMRDAMTSTRTMTRSSTAASSCGVSAAVATTSSRAGTPVGTASQQRALTRRPRWTTRGTCTTRVALATTSSTLDRCTRTTPGGSTPARVTGRCWSWSTRSDGLHRTDAGVRRRQGRTARDSLGRRPSGRSRQPPRSRRQPAVRRLTEVPRRAAATTRESTT